MAQPTEFEETITGGVYDKTGLAFIVFLRVSNPRDTYSCSEVMAQTPYGEVFIIEQAADDGSQRKASTVLLANPRRKITVKIKNSIETHEDSLAKSFMAANSAHAGSFRRLRAEDVSQEFWVPLNHAHVKVFLDFIAKGPFGPLVKPV